jgi:hypothetical protein
LGIFVHPGIVLYATHRDEWLIAALREQETAVCHTTTATMTPSTTPPPPLEGLISFVRNTIPFLKSSSSSSSSTLLGTVWQGAEASRAWTTGRLVSLQNNHNTTAGAGGGPSPPPLKVCFRNASNVPLILCWVEENGTLRHFYKLLPPPTTTITARPLQQPEQQQKAQQLQQQPPPPPPLDPTTSIVLMTESDHMEYTCAGHAFCIAYIPNESKRQEAIRSQSVPDASCIIGGYRSDPLLLPLPESSTSNDDPTDTPVYLVTISQHQRPSSFSSASKDETLCCGAGGMFGLLRGVLGSRKRALVVVEPLKDESSSSKVDQRQEEEEGGSATKSTSPTLEEKEEEEDAGRTTTTVVGGASWTVHVQPALFDVTPLDTTTKVYHRTVLGGWPVYLEPNWHDGDVALEQRLADDLKHVATTVLPQEARDYLQEHCPVWVNKSLVHGLKACLVQAKGCCYHSDLEWIKNNKFHLEKAHSVEIREADFYRHDVNLWGMGGVMVHEFSHAYHHLMIPGGFENAEILECYTAAMKEGLYDCVAVHGTQGPECKAYACTNCMEYFAELSTAFLGGTKTGEEYNKWYPFNRQQLKEHDPRAYQLLSRLWKVNCNV